MRVLKENEGESGKERENFWVLLAEAFGCLFPKPFEVQKPMLLQLLLSSPKNLNAFQTADL